MQKSHRRAGRLGATGTSSNYNLYIHTKDRSEFLTRERSIYVEAGFHITDMLNDIETGRSHRELHPAEILKGEIEVCRAVDANIRGCVNPFDVEEIDR